jgi:hypothetical protein
MSSARPRTKTSRKTAFVPRTIFVGALATTSVVPMIACGGSVQTEVFTVAALGFDAGDARGTRSSSSSRSELGVAYSSFSSDTSNSFTASVAATSFTSETYGVAATSFTTETFGVSTTAFTSETVASTPRDAGRDAPIAFVAACCFDASIGVDRDAGRP